MDRLHLMSVFVAVAQEESFARAARKLHMSPPAVTRAIATLEHRLRVKLLTRTTRFVRATEVGLRYLEQARRVIAVADEADAVATGLHALPAGNISITAPVLFGQMYVMPHMLEYLRRYPDVSASAYFLDRVVNLLEEGIDVGVRIGALADSTFRAIGVGHVRRVTCAAPSYLEKRGIPRLPSDLGQHDIIAATGASAGLEWKFFNGKKPTQVRVIPRLAVTSNQAAIQAAAQGFGVTRLLSYQIEPLVAAGELRIVLAKYESPPLPIHVMHAEGRQPSAKIRTFVDFLVEQLRADTALH